MDHPKHLLDILERNFKNTPHMTAFHFFHAGKNQWLEITWAQYWTKVHTIAKFLRTKSIQQGDCVAILSTNRPEWIICDLAIQALGAVSIPIFPNAHGQDISYILRHSESRALFIDIETRMTSVSLPESLKPSCVFCFEHDEFKNLLHSSEVTQASTASISPQDLATIVYTSGTTGVPKGVMHSHSNLIAAAHAIKNAVNEGKSEQPDLFLSFLPLSHVAERALVEIGSLATGSPVVFARKVETFIEDAIMWKPTILLCVPRLWEKVYERINNNLKSSSVARRSVFKLALRLGQRRIKGSRILKKRDSLITSKVADRLVGEALKRKLGFERIRLFLTGSAPTRPELIKFFGSLGIFIREVYGMTENLCLGNYTGPDEIRLKSSGKAFPQNEVRIASDGEILFRAPWNFKGYYKDPRATAETLSAEGWLATGDLGRVDQDGYLFITGRKKELLKTSNGKYVAPVPLEDDIKAQELVEDAIVIGEGHKYCVALVSLSAPKQGLTDPEACAQMESHLKQLLETINKSRARHEQVKKIGILKKGFTIESGLLTPSMKLKRREITTRYDSLIKKLYESDHSILWE